MSFARRLAGLVISVASPFSCRRWSGAQSFDFQAPLAAADPKTPASCAISRSGCCPFIRRPIPIDILPRCRCCN